MMKAHAATAKQAKKTLPGLAKVLAGQYPAALKLIQRLVLGRASL